MKGSGMINGRKMTGFLGFNQPALAAGAT